MRYRIVFYPCDWHRRYYSSHWCLRLGIINCNTQTRDEVFCRLTYVKPFTIYLNVVMFNILHNKLHSMVDLVILPTKFTDETIGHLLGFSFWLFIQNKLTGKILLESVWFKSSFRCDVVFYLCDWHVHYIYWVSYKISTVKICFYNNGWLVIVDNSLVNIKLSTYCTKVLDGYYLIVH